MVHYCNFFDNAEKTCNKAHTGILTGNGATWPQSVGI